MERRFVRRRFHERHVDRALALFKKHGLLAVVGSVAPSAAGAVQAVCADCRDRQGPALDFFLAVGLGRGIRYFGEGLLALWYGERAADFIRDNARAVSLTVGVLVAW